MILLICTINLIKLANNFVVVILGRLLAGCVSGVASVLFQDQLRKMIPEEAMQTYGISTNALINVGVLGGSIVSSVILPTYDD